MEIFILKNKWKLILGITFVALFFVSFRDTSASTNVTSTACCHWAWNDSIGWIDFYNTNSVTVSSQNLTGWASSSVGYVSLDCHNTPPNGNNICYTSDYQVTNDGMGYLSGWAWNDNVGWISLDCRNSGGCGTGPGSSTYEVVINPDTGDFSNYAWNDVVGWISFCGGLGTGDCPGSVGYKVNAAWSATSTSGSLYSSTFDTGVSAGAQLNSVLWQGNLPSANTYVKFQFATSNSSSGPWTNFVGNDGTSNSYYTPGAANTSLPLNYTFHNNFRYFRYRVILYSNQAQTLSPRVDEVIVNWSP